MLKYWTNSLKNSYKPLLKIKLLLKNKNKTTFV